MHLFLNIHTHKRHAHSVLKFFICAFIFFSASPVTAEEPHLSDLTIANTRDHLLAYISTEGAFTPKLESAVMSGAPVTFSFPVTLYRLRSFWVNNTISDMTATHTIKYNTLKKEFTVTRSWESTSHTTTEFDKAKILMSKIEGIKVIPLSELEKGERYQIRAKAELSKVRLPLYLHYVLFFVSLWDFETDWYAVEFIY